MRHLLPLLVLSTAAIAHPLGRDEYSLRAGIEADDEGVRVVVMGEIPVAEVILGLGELAGGAPPTRAHQQAWTRARLDELAAAQSLKVDGAPAEVSWSPSGSALNGRAVDGFFVYVVETRLPADADGDMRIELENAAWSDKPMVYANQVRAKAGWSVKATTASDTWSDDASQRAIVVHFQRAASARSR